MHRQRQNSESGFAMLSLAVVATLAALMFIAYLSMSSSLTRDTSKSYQINSTLHVLNENFSRIASHAMAIEISKDKLVNSTAFECFSTPPCTLEERPFALFDSGGTLVADMSDSGFTRTGDACTGYGTNSTCVFRFEMTWKPQCVAPCPTPRLTVIGRLRTTIDPTEAAINTSRYDFELSL